MEILVQIEVAVLLRMTTDRNLLVFACSPPLTSGQTADASAIGRQKFTPALLNELRETTFYTINERSGKKTEKKARRILSQIAKF